MHPGNIFHPDFIRAASSAAELVNVGVGGGVFFPLIVESLGLWTASGLFLLCHIAVHTTFRSSVSPGTAFDCSIRVCGIFVSHS